MERHPSPVPFETLVRAHHDAVYRSALRITASDADARDVAQEVFLRVLQDKLAVEEDGARGVLCWWSVRIALDTKRSAARRRRREDRHAMERERNRQQEPRADTEQLSRLWGFVAGLPDELRVPLVLRFHEGLGYARIGEAIGIAESTAHERVQRALERMKRALAAAGLGALAVDLEQHVGRAQPAGSPQGLLDGLLGLRSATTTSGVFTTIASLGGLTAVSLVVAASWHLTRPDADDPARAVAAESARDRIATVDATEPAYAVATDRVAADDRVVTNEGTHQGDDLESATVLHGVARGRVLDHAGRPLEGCTVDVVSAEYVGKQARFHSSTATDATGLFQVPVELADERGGLFRAHAQRASHDVQRSDLVRVLPGRAADFGVLEAAPVAACETGSYSLDVEVIGPDDGPVADVRLDVFTRVPEHEGPTDIAGGWRLRGEWLEQHEVRLDTDGSGLARHEGELLGSKLLRLVPQSAELAPATVRFAASNGEAISLSVRLDPGLSIAGTVLTFDGAVPDPRSILLEVPSRTTGWSRYARPDEHGRFLVEGLEPGEHRVKVGNDLGGVQGLGWSAGELIARAGTDDLQIVIKRADDPRDVGLHEVELHGRVVDARDGSPVDVSFWDLELFRLRPEDVASVEHDWLPNHLFPSSAQKMATGPIPEDSDCFHRTGLESGTYMLRCLLQGYAATFSGPYVLGENKVMGDLVLRLQPAGVVAGRVFDGDHQPVQGATVFVTGVGERSTRVVETLDERFRQSDGRQPLYDNGAVRTDSAGRFRIEGIPLDRSFRLVALHPKHEPSQPYSTALIDSGAYDELEVRLGPMR